ALNIIRCIAAVKDYKITKFSKCAREMMGTLKKGNVPANRGEHDDRAATLTRALDYLPISRMQDILHGWTFRIAGSCAEQQRNRLLSSRPRLRRRPGLPPLRL